MCHESRQKIRSQIPDCFESKLSITTISGRKASTSMDGETSMPTTPNLHVMAMLVTHQQLTNVLMKCWEGVYNRRNTGEAGRLRSCDGLPQRPKQIMLLV